MSSPAPSSARRRRRRRRRDVDCGAVGGETLTFRRLDVSSLDVSTPRRLDASTSRRFDGDVSAVDVSSLRCPKAMDANLSKYRVSRGDSERYGSRTRKYGMRYGTRRRRVRGKHIVVFKTGSNRRCRVNCVY